jgi:sialate O-acetylesterase
MVLQRAPQRAVVWGFGDANMLTTLTINDKIYTTLSQSEFVNTQNESIWSITLDPVSDERPFEIHVSQPLPNGTIVTVILHDVLFGDVWICSGQSNMQLTVQQIFNATEEIANAINYPKIRLFTASLNQSTILVEEPLGIFQNWAVASPDSVRGSYWIYFSATCWLYGRMIHVALGKRPLGLVATSWGGTAIDVWMPTNALHECNETVTDRLFESNDYPSNHSCLFNSMIYPFTRMVIYGAIWYQGTNISNT